MKLKLQTSGRLVRKGLEGLKAEPPKIARQRMYQTLFRAMQRLKKPGKKPKRPIPWVTIRQRRAFYASGGFGGGIPHRRRGDYQRGFRIRSISRGYELSNPGKATKHIGGDARGRGQSPIHRGTYPLIRDEVDKEVKRLPAAVIQHLQIVARRKGFQVK